MLSRVNKVNVVVSLVVILFSLVILYLIRDFPGQTGPTSGLGPVFVPRLLSITMIILAALIILLDLLTKNPMLEATDEFDLPQIKFQSIIYLCLILLYVLALRELGYIISSLLFGYLAMLYLRTPLKNAIIPSVASVLIFYFFFQLVFRIPLPRFTLL